MTDEKQKEVEKLSDLIIEATRKAFLDLFSNGEHYYYCALITSGKALAPCISAWSQESLSRYSKEHSEEDARDKEFDFRIFAMERAMEQLDSEGFLGLINEERIYIY